MPMKVEPIQERNGGRGRVEGGEIMQDLKAELEQCEQQYRDSLCNEWDCVYNSGFNPTPPSQCRHGKPLKKRMTNGGWLCLEKLNGLRILR